MKVKAHFMNTAETWRELLKQIVSSTKERKRLADHLDINAMTLTRWINNQSDPRQDNLLALLDMLPDYRQQLIQLMKLEFPQYFSEVPVSTIPQDIPSNFYYRVLKEYTMLPPHINATLIPILIAQQALGHLDPQKRGMAAIVVMCTPPLPNGKVRSLSILQGRGTSPWDRFINEYEQLFGSESPLGQAVEQGRVIVISDANMRKQQYPFHTPTSPWTESEMALPIMRHNALAGCLYFASTQHDYFTDELQEVGLSYSTLLSVAFDAARFYAPDDFSFGLIPSLAQQRSVLAHLQNTIKSVMVEYKQNGRILTRLEAEPLAWNQLEQALFRLSAETEL